MDRVMKPTHMKLVLASHLLLLLSSAVSRSVVQVPAQLVGSGYRCRCVPDQWEGVLASVERDFEVRDGTGHMDSIESTASVHYDFINKRFAMTDLSTGRKAVANYIKGYKYVMDSSGCFEIKLDDEMARMCLPDETEYIGDFLLGTDIPVGIWQFSSAYNLSTRTTVLKKNCVPISEEIYMTKNGYASLTSSLYVDIRLGIHDQGVFDAPVDCIKVSIDDVDQQQQLNSQQETVKKRSASFTQSIRHQMSRM